MEDKLRCVKCGQSGDTSIRYNPPHTYAKPKPDTSDAMIPGMSIVTIPDFLSMRCRRCGYEWKMPCADAKEPAP